MSSRTSVGKEIRNLADFLSVGESSLKTLCDMLHLFWSQGDSHNLDTTSYLQNLPSVRIVQNSLYGVVTNPHNQHLLEISCQDLTS